jgi:KTSC domain
MSTKKRPNGGSAMRKTRMITPSAQEQLGAFYGFGPRQTAGISQITGAENPFSNLPVASQQAEFGEFKEIISLKDTLQYYEGQVEYQNMAGLPTEFSYQRQWEDVTHGEKNPLIPGAMGAQLDEDESPAPLTVVPTSTTNPERPRTVAAGYDEDEEKITVVFRDGTFYNYYEVSPSEWAAFKSRVSKGQYIYKYLDFKPRGLADVSQISATARKAFYKLARASQVHSKGAKFKPLNTKRR